MLFASAKKTSIKKGVTKVIIKNGNLLNKDFEFENSDIKFDDKILEIKGNIKEDDEIFDAAGMYVVPGFVDTHMHAAKGKLFIDFDENTAKTVCEFEARMGTTSLAPAISAAPEDKMKRAVKYIVNQSKNLPENCAKLMAVHLEGPFFALGKKGAHLPENIRIPTKEEFDRLYEAGEGLVKLITMAPEIQNGCEVIKHITSTTDVEVSIGHTDATYDEAKCGFESGATRTTHTYNAMSPLNHREPGVVGAALTTDGVNCEMICDFFHVHPAAVKLVIDAKGYDNVTMVTDSEVGTGMPDGEFVVNGRVLTVKDKKTYTEDGTIAGGTSVLLDGIKNVTSIGVPLNMAVKMASFNGAKAIKAQDRIGSLDVGKDADIVVLNKDLNLVKVFLNGKEIV